MLIMIAENDRLHCSFARETIEDLWAGNVEVIEANDGENAIRLSISKGRHAQRHRENCGPEKSPVRIGRELRANNPP